jgi:hypothetical protein
MRELAHHRGTDHDWLEAEARLNARPRFVSELATYVVENGKPLITLIK